MAEELFDFGGYATRNDLRCADGRTIRKNAFKDCDGQTVPLVWQHRHNEPSNILGHAVLENREDGVYTYGTFNDTPAGRNARSLVEHGDISSLSIYANGLTQKGGDVLHGFIREVSLVLAGANPGAYIDYLSMEHSDGDDFEDGEAVIYNDDEELELAHADDHDEENDEEDPDMAERTLEDVLGTLTEEQMNAVAYVVGQAVDEATGGDEEDEEMSHNLFENEPEGTYLTHADIDQIFDDAKRIGSLREAVKQHEENGVLQHAVYDTNSNTVTYGIADIDSLFPEYKELNTPPEFIKRDMTWVDKVMAKVHHIPVSRVKTSFANITMEEARARGYIKGDKKINEVFTLLRRTTDPTTVYKHQQFDRDDTIDITDFSVVAWVKTEMRMMLNEELARAFLIGDGRLTSDRSHIDENHIRPIWKDDDLFTLKYGVAQGSDAAATAKNFIRKAVKARKDYKGSGNPTLYTTEDWLTEMLLLEDQIGHRLYKTEAELATAMRVSEIVTVPVMEGQSRNGHALMGIIVNLADYDVGADKGGSVEMFDDFDIDYNQLKYLIETRCSGGLVKPFSAMVFEEGASGVSYTVVAEPAVDANPSTEGWYEKNGTVYTKSKDTTVNESKDYYARTES